MSDGTKLLSKDDLLTIYAIWRKVGTRALINAVRFCQHYQPVSPDQAGEA